MVEEEEEEEEDDEEKTCEKKRKPGQSVRCRSAALDCTCVWDTQTAYGGGDMGKQVRKSAETDFSRMQGEQRTEKHISVQTGRGRDRDGGEETERQIDREARQRQRDVERETHTHRRKE